jgi:acyl-CoA synthetase (AMP-forming)/AMP-acid ligase II
MTLHNSAIAEILIQLNKNSPKKVIITDLSRNLREGGQKVTVNEIYDDAIKIALNLQANGFKINDRVAIAAPPNAEFLKIMYALIFLKATVAIIDPEMGRDNYNSKLKQFNPQWAFVDARLLLLQEHPILRFFYLKKSKTAPYFPYTPSANIIACGGWLPLFQKKIFLNKWINKPLIGEFNWEINKAPDLLNLKNLVNLEPNLSDNKNKNLIKNNAQNSQNTEGGHDFLITYTSGTIAEPKGVVHSFNSLLNSIQLIGTELNPEKETLIATYLPHYMLIGFAVKIPSILYNPKLSAIQKLAFFADNKVTTIMGPPSDFVPTMEHCEQTKTLFPDTMQHILLGSAPVTRRFLRRLSAVLPAHTRITCLYGMTENLLVATIDGRFKMDYDCEGDLLGKPAEGVEIKIMGDEIVLKSNQLFSRYFHLKDRNEFHETGDLGNFDKNNYLILRGRKKDMIIRRNLNIYPAIYEATINRMDGVTEAVLVGIYDDLMHDEKVYLIIEGEDFLNKKNILNQLKTGIYSIDAEAMPDEILFMQLPRSGRQHKVNKEAIRAMLK